MNKKTARTKKSAPKKVNKLTEATRQDHTHLHSEAIRSRRLLFEFEVAQVEDHVASLKAALVKARERGRRLREMIEGLSEALRQRG